MLPVETVAAGLRTWLLCRVLQPGVRFWTCLKAEWANPTLAMLTPSQTGGGPGQIYVLTHGGVRLTAALTATVLSFVGTMVGLLCIGLYSILGSGTAHIGPLFAGAVWAMTGISALIMLGASCPGCFRVVLAGLSRTIHGLRPAPQPLPGWWPPGVARFGPPVDRMGPWAGWLVDVLYSYRGNIARILRSGRTSFAWVCLLSLAFLFVRALMPCLWIRFLGLEAASFRHVIEAQLALIFAVYFAPTPGAAGFAESASMSILAKIVPIGYAPYYNLLWRFSTVYLPAAAGCLCLLHAMQQDGRQVLRQVQQEKRCPPAQAKRTNWGDFIPPLGSAEKAMSKACRLVWQDHEA